MLIKLRERMGREEGFTLIELLVVMLILGILAAIAIPAFFNQRDKARDADAKAAVRTAETAMETYATDHNGEYTAADAPDLSNIEDTLTSAVSPSPVPLAGRPDRDRIPRQRRFGHRQRVLDRSYGTWCRDARLHHPAATAVARSQTATGVPSSPRLS